MSDTRTLTTARKRLAALLIAGAALFLGPATGAEASGVTVTDLDSGATATQIAQTLAGPGVTISNVTYTGANRAAGSFTGGAGSIGFDSGTILDSGNVQTNAGDSACSVGVEGPNSCNEGLGSDNSTNFGNPGDSDLTTLAAFPTFDASVLEFDFVPQTATLEFNYVFSSEEYSNYANSTFNDVFGFFVNGTNCALVPGTTEPVSVNTINNGNDNGGDTTPHHADLFRDNVNPSPTIDSQMDGLTTVLACQATVNPGQTNHMKLAIADGSDGNLDSAVFLQAGSFVSGTTCPKVTASVSGYRPKKKLKPTTPGVRSWVYVDSPSQVTVSATLARAGGHAAAAGRKQVSLGTFTMHDSGRKKLRIAIPKKLRGEFPLGTKVNLTLEVTATPDSGASCKGTATTQTLKTRVVHIFHVHQP